MFWGGCAIGVSVPSLINLALELATELRRHGRLLRKGLQAVTILMAIRLHSISFPEAKSQILHGKGWCSMNSAPWSSTFRKIQALQNKSCSEKNDPSIGSPDNPNTCYEVAPLFIKPKSICALFRPKATWNTHEDPVVPIGNTKVRQRESNTGVTILAWYGRNIARDLVWMIPRPMKARNF